MADGCLTPLGGRAKLSHVCERSVSPSTIPHPVQEKENMAEYDLIIRNGTIVDGTGGIPAYHGDIAIKQGKIAMISGRIKATANKEVDATGCIVAPGAIDLHNHYDL